MRYQKISRKQMSDELIARIGGKETIVKAPVVGPVVVKLFETPVVKEIVIPEKVANIIVMEDKSKKKRNSYA